MSQPRSGEESIPSRNPRFVCTNGVWYFKARGGNQIGPFTDRQEMQNELTAYINEQQKLSMSDRN